MADLLVSFGSVNVDIAAHVETLPRPGETVLADRYAIGLGGKGANQAAAAARLAGPLAGAGALRVALAGRVGADAFGALARERLAAFGVELDHLRQDDDHPTGIALIGIDARGENAVTVAAGANGAVDATDVDALAPRLRQARVLMLQGETPLRASLAAARLARAAGAAIILDPAPVPPAGLPDDAWSLLDFITPNETEAARLVGVRPADPAGAAIAAERLQARGARGVVVTLGAGGTVWLHGAEGGFVPPFPVAAIDSVAAGDCFNAGLAVALARGEPVADAVRFAAACGALATTRIGAAEAAPAPDEVRALLG